MARRIFTSAQLLRVMIMCCVGIIVAGVRNRALSRNTPSQAAAKNVKDKGARIIALFGLTGDGKSTLCNWLAGKVDACKVGEGLESETSEVLFASHSWFGDGQEDVIVADTPGISDTKGRDAKQWVATVSALKKKLTALDVVVLVVNAQQERMKEDRRAMITVLRDSFGTDIWSHFCVVFTHHPWKAPGNRIGGTPEKLEKKAEAWRSYFKDFELARKDAGWKAESRKLIEAEIDAIPFFAVELDPDVDVVSAANPTFTGDDEGLDKILGLPQLVKLKDWLAAKDDAIDLANLRPRMGPSEVIPGGRFECLMPRPCNLQIRGKHLSDRDHVSVTPITSQCGEPNARNGGAPVQFPVKRSAPGGNDAKQVFDLGTTLVGEGEFRLCYCEYGNCDTPERFSQDAGYLTLKFVSCKTKGCTPNVAETRASSDAPWLPCEPERSLIVKYGESALYKCASGHTVAGRLGEETFGQECFSTGDFAPAPFGCERTQCGYAPTVPHARVGSTAVLSFGDVVEYTCEPGYTLTGGSTKDGSAASFSQRCSEDGTLIGNEILTEKGCRRWEAGEWSQCTAECGHGSRSRHVFCSTGDDADCDARFKLQVDGTCESYTGCDGCANRIDCQVITVNEIFKRSVSSFGYSNLASVVPVPSISSGRLSPVTSCVCTDQCWLKKDGESQRLIEREIKSVSFPLNHTIHSSCFYDTVSKQCGCANEQSRTGHLWRVVGSGLCADEAGQNLKGGYAIIEKFDNTGWLDGPRVTFARCKKACIEDGACPGIWFGDQSTWYPAFGKVGGESQCFIYSGASAESQNVTATTLRSERYNVRIHSGTPNAIAKSSGVRMTDLKRRGILQGIGEVAKWAQRDLLGGLMSGAEDRGHCYKLLRE